MPKVRRRTPPSTPRGYDLEIVEVTGSITLSENYRECVLQTTAGSAMNITLPNSLPVGWYCLVEQGGTGQVTFVAGTGATLRNVSSHDKTSGQYAVCTLYVRDNDRGVGAEYNLTGGTTV